MVNCVCYELSKACVIKNYLISKALWCVRLSAVLSFYNKYELCQFLSHIPVKLQFYWCRLLIFGSMATWHNAWLNYIFSHQVIKRIIFHLSSVIESNANICECEQTSYYSDKHLLRFYASRWTLMWWKKDLLHFLVWAYISNMLNFDRFEWFIILIQMGVVPKEVLFINVTRISWCFDKPSNILQKPLVFKTSVTLIIVVYIIAGWTTTRHYLLSVKSPLWPQRT